MTRPLPLEIHISDLAFFGLILLIAKQKKASKVCFIIGGCCLLIAFGLCGFGA